MAALAAEAEGVTAAARSRSSEASPGGSLEVGTRGVPATVNLRWHAPLVKGNDRGVSDPLLISLTAMGGTRKRLLFALVPAPGLQAGTGLCHWIADRA
jgi:hypothetical protein